ncbi:MAG: diguanylate cyclase [Halofilum sp. (in: g-proteobacteria)]|nr:diguanylate cyclase [Halofilum sp. (in: g-proteobacteria)]
MTPELYEAAFDGLPDCVAVIDAGGRILRVNARWRAFAGDNGGDAETAYVGWNYLDVCRGSPDDEASAVTTGLERLLAGEQDVLDLEYPCHSPDVDRWFLLHAARLVVDGHAYAIVAHVDITQRRLAEMAAARRAERDELTGLLNRGTFRQRLQQALQAAGRRNRRVAVLFFDLDGFKDVNDGHGHAVGDILLRVIGARLQEHFRAEDAVARFGGDEFVLFIEHGPDDELDPLTDRLHGLLRREVELEGRTLRLAASLGVSIFPLDGDHVDTLIQRADLAMYRAKQDAPGATSFARDLVRT